MKDEAVTCNSKKRFFFLGFGSVNRALAKMLLDETKSSLFDPHGGYEVVGVASGSHGLSAIIYDGEEDATSSGPSLCLDSMINIAASGGDLSNCALVGDSVLSKEKMIRMSGAPTVDQIKNAIQSAKPHVVFEAIPLDPDAGEPASTLIHASLMSGAHVMSANKGPVIHNHNELMKIAKSKGLSYRHESAVMDGVPIFSFWERVVPGANLLKVEGVLNATTNMIMSRMELEGETFEEALAVAQREGIAEADPSNDIDGIDATFKLVALCNVLMGQKLRPSDVQREGIRSITPDMIRQAKAEGTRYRLVCSAERRGSDKDSIDAKVELRRVKLESPFAALQGASSAVVFVTDVLGPVTLTSTDPTTQDTAYGLLSDCLIALNDAQ